MCALVLLPSLFAILEHTVSYEIFQLPELDLNAEYIVLYAQNATDPPSLSISLHPSPTFTLLLSQVKGTRGFHFCEIVSVDRLQRQLAEDIKRPAACRAMTQLLLNSYYPQNSDVGGTVSGSGVGPGVGAQGEGSSAEKNYNQVNRCLLFIKENPMAAVAFYGTFHRFASVGSSAKVNQTYNKNEIRTIIKER